MGAGAADKPQTRSSEHAFGSLGAVTGAGRPPRVEGGRTSMAKRMILMLIGVALLVGVLAAVKAKQVQAAIKQNSSFKPPPEAVTTVVAKSEPWPDNLAAIGTVVAVRG